jgi:hypothetical protein
MFLHDENQNIQFWRFLHPRLYFFVMCPVFGDIVLRFIIEYSSLRDFGP